jgi:hypothetical protein
MLFLPFKIFLGTEMLRVTPNLTLNLSFYRYEALFKSKM